jgi:glyoxylase-like metal-dependent hydrolase (beta-lactamase superfamily II)
MRATEVTDGIVRLTFELPLGIDHVHCYALRAASGGWTIVDTGLGVDDATARWDAARGELGGPIERIVITHFHPDHVGAAAVLAGLTNAPVLQGPEDYAQCVRAWGPARSPEQLVEYMLEHGLPAETADELRRESGKLARLVHYAHDPEPLVPGEHLDGWEILHLPGHADGHICLLRNDILIAGDALLATISPNVGLYPDARPDPLGDYLDSLKRIVELAPRVAYAGHGPTIDNPVERAKVLVAHHHDRLDQTTAALDSDPRTAYEVSLRLFPGALPSVLRRFALAESRAHLEYLVLRDRIRRVRDRPTVAYTAG